jgi:hypothetical protein
VYKDRLTIMQDLKGYASPKSRLTRMIRAGEVVQVRRGIFIDSHDRNYSLKSLANIIYGPSYISFEYALSHYGLIPELASSITSAVYNKNKNKVFNTSVGTFYYYYLPVAVYPYEIVQDKENGESYLIATREKALCDVLYKVKGVASFKAFKYLLFEDLRLDPSQALTLDKESLLFLCGIYKKKIFRFLKKWINRESVHA